MCSTAWMIDMPKTIPLYADRLIRGQVDEAFGTYPGNHAPGYRWPVESSYPVFRNIKIWLGW